MPRTAPAAMPDCTLALKVVPRSSRDAIAGWQGDALRVRVRAPALEGRANDALLDFLAAALKIPRRTLTLVRGATSRHKQVHVAGLSLADTKARLASAPVT